MRVYGITEAGKDVRCELVQVLQNRLDDAVLEILSVMLARNAMCPLSPEDVRFLQKPFRSPEVVIKVFRNHKFSLKYFGISFQCHLFLPVVGARILLEFSHTFRLLSKAEFASVSQQSQVHRYETGIPFQGILPLTPNFLILVKLNIIIKFYTL